jgi:hypothetical protein
VFSDLGDDIMILYVFIIPIHWLIGRLNAKRQPFPTEPLIMTFAVTFTTYKMIDWLTKQISKYETLDNNKEVKLSKEEKQELGREINMIT